MRLKFIVGLAAVMSLIATSASAASITSFDFTLDDTTAGAYSGTSSTVELDDSDLVSAHGHLEGIRVSHEDGNDDVGSSGDEPNDGDIVAEISANARWAPFFCARSTISIDGVWQSPMDSPPAEVSDPVAQIQASAFGSTTDVWVVHSDVAHHSTVDADHYDLVVTGLTGESTCSGSMTLEISTLGTVDGTNRKVTQNPTDCTKTYDVEFHITDSASNTDQASDTYSVTGCT